MHPQWCEDVHDDWLDPLENSPGIVHWTQIRNNTGRTQTGGKVLITQNNNTYDWSHTQNNDSWTN